MKKSRVQSHMFEDMQNKELFYGATSLGFDYLQNSLERHVFPTSEALEKLSKFDENMPEGSSTAREVLDLLQEYGAPATVNQVGGRYFGFVNGSVIPASLAVKNLSTFWDQNSAMQVLSPIAAKLETVTQKWLKELFGLPDSTVAGFVSGTSMANFCGLAAARYRILERAGWDVNEMGLFGAPRIRIVAGKQAHSTVLKAIGLIGFGKTNVEWVNEDQQGRIVEKEIPQLDDRTILILQAGNVNSGAFDNFEVILKQAKEAGAWVHIDGAFGLWAAATTKLNYLTKGFEQANSWAVDGHKTLNTPYDSGVILCNDQDALTSALHMAGAYIITGDGRDGMFYTPEMSRRARVFEFWAALKYLGKEGVNEMIYGLHERAQQFAQELTQISGFTVINDVVFNQVIVQCKSDLMTERVLRAIQDERECWVGGSTWKGNKVIRISVCSWATTSLDVTRSVSSFKRAIQRVTKAPNITP